MLIFDLGLETLIEIQEKAFNPMEAGKPI